MEVKSRILEQIDISICEGNYQEAIKTSKQGYKCFKDVCFLDKVLKIHETTGNFKEAISVLGKMLKICNNDKSLIEKTAYYNFRLGKYKEALKKYQVLLEFNPLSSRYNFNVACMYDYLKDFDNALKYYRYAINADNSNYSALNNYALVLYTLKQYDSAIKIYKDVMQKVPYHPEAYHHMGIIYRDYLKDLELSLLHLKKAYRLDKKYFLNPYHIALTYKAMNDIPSALEYLQKTLELNPQYEPAKKMLKELQKA